MEKNILVITGSPRKHGNSDMLADAFIAGARKAGHTVEKYETAFTKISGCRACDTCWTKGVPCSFNDAFNEKFAPLLEKADMLVLCTPLYYYGIASSLQATIEKTYAYLSPQSPAKIKISEIALLVCGGEENSEAYSGVLNTYQQIYRAFQWNNRGIIVASGILEKGKIIDTDYLVQAQKLGESI